MLHRSPRGTASCCCSRKEEASDASKEENCFNSFRKASHTPPRALRLRAAAGVEKISSLQCNSCLAFGGFMVRLWIACTRCQEYMVPLCDAPCNRENLAVLCIPGQFPGESPISFTPALGSY